MKKGIAKILGVLAATVLALGLGGCGQSEGEKTADTSEVANDYYIDLTDLGMNLTIYLRLDEAGTFTFSNTLDFETVKSSGTFQESDDEYMMVYDSVNGEEKSVSDGLTSTFVVLEDGSLDFTCCDYIYYGSAKATTTSEDNPDAKLVAYMVTDDYSAPDTSTEFEMGSYAAADVTEDGVTYSHMISFYEDDSYLHLIRYEKDGTVGFTSETGTYGVNITQLALEPEGGERISSEVADGETLNVSVFPYPGAAERSEMEFKKTSDITEIAALTGKGMVTGSDETFEVELRVYSDGSYEAEADGFTETGILAVDTENATVKQYPDHPETGVRGLNQVATVPAGTCSSEGGKLAFSGLRIRKSEGLTRYECSVEQK